jgi:hypothetical protein
MTAPRVRRIWVEPLVAAAFAPSGTVITVADAAPNSRSAGGAVGGEFELEARGHALLTVSRSAFRGLTFKRLERHLERTHAPRRQLRADHPLPVGRARRVLLETAAGVSPPGRGDERALIELGEPVEPPDRDGSDG